MYVIKRIEIIADSVEVGEIIAVLEKGGVNSYTVFHNVTGKGGKSAGDFDIGGLENDYVIAFCTEEKLKPLVEQVRQVLNTFGGSCFISDAMEIKSMRCVASL